MGSKKVVIRPRSVLRHAANMLSLCVYYDLFVWSQEVSNPYQHGPFRTWQARAHPKVNARPNSTMTSMAMGPLLCPFYPREEVSFVMSNKICNSTTLVSSVLLGTLILPQVAQNLFWLTNIA